MAGRQQAREHGRVRGQGQRAVADESFEDDALAGEGIHHRRGPGLIPVDAQPIRAQGVDGDEDHWRGGVSRNRPATPPTGKDRDWECQDDKETPLREGHEDRDYVPSPTLAPGSQGRGEEARPYLRRAWLATQSLDIV